MAKPTPEVFLEAQATLAEGPIWDHRKGELCWVDILDGRVWAVGRDGAALRSIEVGQAVGFVALRQAGGLVAGMRDGFGVIDQSWRTVGLTVAVEAQDRSTRMNDGACDPRGRVFGGTMAFDESPGRGNLYRLDPDWTVTRVLHGVSISNGIDWSPDGTLMYYVDSPTRRVDVFDYSEETGAISNRRTFVELDAQRGMPDGLCVDSAGDLWVALWGGGAVAHFDREGRFVEAYELPASNVSACCFGGADYESLFITTAKHHLDAAELARQPHAGDLFVVRPGAQGRPAFEFAG
jgi:sugar lactone lactonase YvrE